MDQHVKTRYSIGRYESMRAIITALSRTLLYVCFPVAMATGCSPDSHPNSALVPGESLQENHVPIIRSARIVPVPLTLESPISVEVDAADVDGDLINYEYRWWVNDTIFRDAITQTVSTELFKKGDKVMVEIVAYDGKAKSPAFTTEPVEIQNGKLGISRVSLELESRPASTARLKAKIDAVDRHDQDIRYTYRWWRNDTLIKEGHEDFLDTAGLARKDAILVEVIPDDPDLKGTSYKSPPAVIGNAPPKILSSPSTPDRQGHYQYRVQADDPDGDSLLYALETAPPGMIINSASGQITWTISPELVGTHRVKISVDDGQGGLAWQEFEISIPSTTEPSSVQPART
jgi:Putative Ig domain